MAAAENTKSRTILGRTQQLGILPALLSYAIASSRALTTNALPCRPLNIRARQRVRASRLQVSSGSF